MELALLSPINELVYEEYSDPISLDGEPGLSSQSLTPNPLAGNLYRPLEEGLQAIILTFGFPLKDR